MTRFLAIAVALFALLAAPALADAPDPIPAATHGSVVLHADGSRTLTVYGGTDATTDPGWRWTTHKSDCNTDRSGAGVAIAWNDPTDPGNPVTGTVNAVSVTVGMGTSTDNVIHPTPLLSPAGSVVDIATPADWHNWRGGCGLYVDHPTPVSLPDGTTKTGKWSQGTWGPFSHTYPASVTGPVSACPLMYDVHGNASNTQPTSESDVTAGGANHDGDNSLQKNATTPQGNGCFALDVGSSHLSIVKEVSADGGASYSKSASVHEGDVVRYRFTVTNDGAVDLVNVHVNDLTGIADCDSSMTGPAGFTGALAAGASAAFTCNHTMGASALVNTANAAGSYTPPGGGSVDVTSSNDSASVDVVPGPRNPAIAIDKTGPATATAGSAVTYVLTVTNPGNVPFNETALSVTDAQCNGAPVTLTGKGSDASPGSLDPGDAWTYSCSVQTAATDTAIHNVATVAATDPAGTSASATDDADTALTAPTAAAPGTTPGDQLVLGARIVPGRAQLLGPTGCAAKAFNARVRGTKISSVTIKLDGKVVKRFKNVGSKTVAYRIDPSKLRIGVHRLVATITFQKGSGTKPKTMRLSFQRCSKKLSAPRFTG